MADILFEGSRKVGPLEARKVGVIGYGSQGHAHALNLRDSGIDVRVGVRRGKSRTKAQQDGFAAGDVAQIAAWADVIVLLAPDTRQPAIFKASIAPHLQPNDVLMFAHGFNIRYETITPKLDVDVALVAPKAPGHRVRETYVAGEGTPALIAVHQDASGEAWDIVRAYACAIGCARAGAIATTFAEETETDLFGEQAVLCGGVPELVEAGFETLVAAGYQPEVAYFEVVHELKLIVDLMYRGGLNYVRHSVSDTAEHGGYIGGRKVIGPSSRAGMARMLGEIQNGTYAKRWIEENEKGREQFEAEREKRREHQVETVGAKLRELMPFLEPVHLTPGD